ncbi:metal ABC transporter ATP-binding protein [Verrucomicrobiaceae bacterium N1E253]|uniref:Metal ABC transporter ATP-binding protein n=1 Tax=Oceaniferula marina TaxID=2748318 RepID=A0A851GNF4_9BACT|nr:metal ABC transporter ATP-binding protein [Oceaniferula marina]NWK56567.1 metal ABC transporter ATP-binding protein [Oceaniferula marina]
MKPSPEAFIPALETHDLTVTYHKRPVLYGVDVAIPEGSLVGLIGPNGAGKSTLIKSIMGVIPSSGGWVKVFGKSLKQNIHRVGYVPQRESVDWDFPVTVMDVVMMGTYGRLGWFRRPGKEEKRRAHEALDKIGMLPYANRQIGNLSGGQQQRVFLARALAQNSDLYLMDEPFVGVDAATEAAIVTLLKEMRAEGKTVLVVHHDLQTASDYFDRLMLLNMRLLAYGRTEEVFTPELLQKTYGGRLTLLSEVADRAAKMAEENGNR